MYHIILSFYRLSWNERSTANQDLRSNGLRETKILQKTPALRYTPIPRVKIALQFKAVQGGWQEIMSARQLMKWELQTVDAK